VENTYPQRSIYVVQPTIQDNAVLYVAMLDGYHLVEQRGLITQLVSTGHDDQLGMAVGRGERWVEQAGSESTIVSTIAGRNSIEHAESPVASLDGRWLVFLREDHGRAQMWVRALHQPGNADEPVSPPGLNVFESSFLPTGELIFAAASKSRPSLFVTDRIGNQTGNIRSFDTQETRYPSVSPDGHWLAYSKFQDGDWNLWLRDLISGQTTRLTNAACNAVEPAWASDSKTVVYASDCGRALWFTALCRRHIPH
jgi:Tol biopolymer transport system component